MFKFLKEKLKQITEKFKKKVPEADEVDIDVPEDLEKEFDSPEYEARIEGDKVEIIEGDAEKGQRGGGADSGASHERDEASHGPAEESSGEEKPAEQESKAEAKEEVKEEPRKIPAEQADSVGKASELQQAEEVEEEEEKAVRESLEKEDEVIEKVEKDGVPKIPAPSEPGDPFLREGEKSLPEGEKKGLFKKIIDTVVRKEITEKDLEDVIMDLELGLVEADVSVEVVEKIIQDVKSGIVGKTAGRSEIERMFVETLKKSMKEILDIPHKRLENEIRESEKPYLIVLIGFNGVGKTTTLAKLGKYLLDRGFSVVLAAGDTFRAAAIEQLEKHGQNLGVKVIKKEYGHDSAAVIYDAVQYARKNGIDVVLADTAGRNHEDRNLMDELRKVIRVNKPQKVLLVIDSITGNDAVIQAEKFSEVRVDGTIMTKMDVNEKGGAALSVTYILKKPIYFITVGQDYGDLMEFSADWMIERIFSS